MENLNLILPEIFISLSIMFLLILGVFKNDSSKITFNLSLFAILITTIITFNETFSVTRETLFNGSVVIDSMSSLMKIITLIGGFLVLVISSSYLKIFKIYNIEYPVLILSSILGMMVMISSNDLIVFYMGLELQSLALYVLATYNRDQLKSSEAGLKYFVLSALSSGLLLYGCSLVYGFSGSTNFDVISNQLNSNEYVLTFGIVFILVGLAFKISAVPFHMWAPDVYEGSPTISTLFFATLPKFASLIFLFRVYQELNISDIKSLNYIFQMVCAISLLVGVYGAITQKVIKRLLAFSSINHIGFMLLGIMSYQFMSEGTLFFYLIIYLITTFGIFAVLLNLRTVDGEFTKISQLNGLRFTSNSKSISMLVFFFSLAGIPPFAGFFAKFFILSASINDGFIFLSIIAVLSSVIAAFYYLTIIKNMFFNKSEIELLDDNNKTGKVIFIASGLIITLFFIYPDPLINLVDNLFK